jgi:hypothetical protein
MRRQRKIPFRSNSADFRGGGRRASRSKTCNRWECPNRETRWFAPSQSKPDHDVADPHQLH